VLISVRLSIGFRNLLNCRLRDGAGSCEDELLARLDVFAQRRNVEEGLDSQGPPERLAAHGEIETFRCRVQPSATPWQPEPGIGNNPGSVLTSVVPLRDYSQQC